MISDTHIILCENDGQVVYASDRGKQPDYADVYLPMWALNTVRAQGSYAGMTTFNGLFPENRYVAGVPVVTQLQVIAPAGVETQQVIRGMVFVAADTSSLTELWRAFATIFFFTALVVMLVAFITSSVTTLRLTRPLQEMSDVAYRFAHGEFEAR
jgi:hypothetical protein